MFILILFKPRMNKHSFSKIERLKSRKAIGAIFDSSFSYGKGKIRFLWKVQEASQDDVFCKVMIAVPKRRLKKAVDRNKTKRLLKEAYRRNKTNVCSFYKEKKKCCNLVILYTGKGLSNFEMIDFTMIDLLDKMPKEYEKHFK